MADQTVETHMVGGPMHQAAMSARISAMIEGFVYGLRTADPDAGFGYSEPFDSAFWSILSILEGNGQGFPLETALLKRLPIVLGSSALSAETRLMLDKFGESGDLYGGGLADASSAMPRILGVALCEANQERRLERAVQIVAITHFSPKAAQAAITLVEFFSAIVDGESTHAAIGKARDHVEHPEILDALQLEPAKVTAHLSAEHSVVEVVRWVVWAAHQQGHPVDMLHNMAQVSESNQIAMALGGAVMAAQDNQFGIQPMLDLRAGDIAEEITYWRNQIGSIEERPAT